MIKTVKQACRFNPVIQDYRMSQGIENLADLIHDAGDGREFFSRNFVSKYYLHGSKDKYDSIYSKHHTFLYLLLSRNHIHIMIHHPYQ